MQKERKKVRKKDSRMCGEVIWGVERVYRIFMSFFCPFSYTRKHLIDLVKISHSFRDIAAEIFLSICIKFMVITWNMIWVSPFNIQPKIVRMRKVFWVLENYLRIPSVAQNEVSLENSFPQQTNFPKDLLQRNLLNSDDLLVGTEVRWSFLSASRSMNGLKKFKLKTLKRQERFWLPVLVF